MRIFNKVLLFTFLTPMAFAQSTKELERVMVIGGEENLKKIAGSSHIVNEEDLEKFNYNDINRVLRQVPGLNIQEEEGFGNRPNIGLRGGRSERSADITLMEDGVLIAPAPYSSPSAYYFPRVDRMENVEVRKGSSTIKFGPRTTSGALNLVSSSIPGKKDGELSLTYGADNTRRAQFNYGDSIGRFGYVFDFGHEATDGFKTIEMYGDDTGFSIYDVMAKFRITSDPNADIYQHLEIKLGATKEDSNETYLGVTQSDFEANPYLRYASSQLDNMDADHNQIQLRHYIEPAENWDITTTIYRNNFARNWYKLQSVEINGSKLSLDDALSDSSYLSALKGQTNLAGDSDNNLVLRANNREYYSQGIQTNIGHQFKTKNTSHDLVLGARLHYDEEDRFQHEDLYSINNGQMALTSSGAAGSNANRVGSARALALFVEDEINYNKLSIVPGIRYEYINLMREDRNNSTTYKNDLEVLIPGIGVSYEVNNNLMAFAGVHKGFAPPSPSTNTSQEHEESVNYETGLRYYNNDFKAELVGFFNNYKNLLGEETISSGSGQATGEQFNGGKVNVYGFEFSAEYDLANLLKNSPFRIPVGANYTYTSAEFRSSFDSDFSEWGSVTKGDELPYIPSNQFYVFAGLEFNKWSINSSVKYVDEMRTVAGSGPIQYGSGTDDHFIFDVLTDYKLNERANLFLSAYNLTDEEYVAARRPAGARSGAPRTILTGLKYKF